MFSSLHLATAGRQRARQLVAIITSVSTHAFEVLDTHI